MDKKERPILENLINSKTTAIEKFQNEVIRPIITQQHSFLIAVFQHYLFKRKIDFSNISEEKKTATINTSLKNDVNFKNLLIGSVIGHFSIDELVVYHQNTSDFNRRITQIINQRFIDNSYEI